VSIRMGLLEDLVTKDYIDILYKIAKHILNVCFRVLVWAIRVLSQKYVSCFQITRNLYPPSTPDFFLLSLHEDLKKPHMGSPPNELYFDQ
jgi:hypothetical protein